MFAKPGGFGCSRAPPEIDPCFAAKPSSLHFSTTNPSTGVHPQLVFGISLNTLSASAFAPEGPSLQHYKPFCIQSIVHIPFSQECVFFPIED